MKNNKNLIFILGDQLSKDISSLDGMDKKSAVIVMAEVQDETTYVRHHKLKIAFLFSAMRHFAEQLRADGWEVDYTKLDGDDEAKSFTQVAERAIEKYRPLDLTITEASEWRVMEDIKAWSGHFDLPVNIRPDKRFIATHDEFKSWADGRKQLRMEYFYREMRRKTRLLMNGDEPEGGEWNYDWKNRKPAKPDLFMPKPIKFEPDEISNDVISLVGKSFKNHFGDLDAFNFAVTADQAQEVLNHFIDECLPRFGDYQDAMLEGEPTLYHSLLSFYINSGLLDPLAVCQRVQDAYRNGNAPLNAAEGFIRQIIGWREYVRGIYWLKMPDYRDKNFFSNTRQLPEIYWSADTDMLCMAEVIGQTIKYAYAHHIQRLMITGNFALLAGIEPKQVHEWYLAVYADAFEWVELPNTLGMSQFADGGLLGSKPYAASGNYINKMSNYCDNCRYDVKQKTGPGACPFNPLYWDFLIRNRSKLQHNPRISRAYTTWDKMSEEKREDYLRSAQDFLETLS